MRCVWYFLLLAGCCAAQQTDYVLAGTVVNAKTGEPVKRALVTATRIITPQEAGAGSGVAPFTGTALTDVSGMFRFPGLAAGLYNLFARKPGFSGEPAEVPVKIESSNKEDVRLELPPLGTIEGRIVDQRGGSVPGASVLVIKSYVKDGARQDGARQFSVVRTVLTDDRGTFRVWNMDPGRYLVKAAGRRGMTYTYLNDTGATNGGFAGFVPAYFGGPTADSATPIVIEQGTEARADIGVVVQPTHKVRGTVEGFGMGDVTFALLFGDDDVGAGRVNFSRATGAFEMLQVVNGTYTLRAAQTYNATADLPIVVQGADVNGLRMVLAEPIEIPVNVSVLGQPEDNESLERARNRLGEVPVPTPAPASGQLKLSAVPSVSGASAARGPGSCSATMVGAGSDSRLVGSPDSPLSVLRGRYRVGIQCWNAYVVSAAMGNADLLANPWISVSRGAVVAPIEVVARHGGGAISGTVRIDHEAAGGAMWVLAVPSASMQGAVFARVQGNPGSQFFFDSLAPGDYLLYVFSTDQIEFQNPEFLRALTGGEGVHVEDSATASVKLTRLVQ